MAIQIGQQGWNQQTPATQTIMRAGMAIGRAIGSRRRTKRSKAVAGKKRKKRAGSSSSPSRKKRSGTSRLVKGSAAAKAYMKKIRAKRK